MPALRKSTPRGPTGLRDGEGVHDEDDLKKVWAGPTDRRSPFHEKKKDSYRRVLAASDGRFACALCAWSFEGDALTGTRLQREHRAAHAPPEVATKPEPRPRGETLLERIPALLRESGPLTAGEVSERTGAGVSVVSNSLQRLVRRGLVRRAGGGGNKLLWAAP